MPVLSIGFSQASAGGSYFPGQNVQGTLKISVTAETKIKSVVVGFLGIGEISTLPKYNEADLGLLTRKSIYLDEMKEIYNFETAGLPAVQMPGDHLFKFNCDLPAELPASFESPQGYLRYQVTAIVDGTEMEDTTVHAMFTVNAIANLNDDRKAKIPAMAWTRNESCMPCLRSAGIQAEVQIYRKGFVPGEMILINAEVTNRNRHPVTAVKATLVQVIKYHHKTGSKKVKRNVCEIFRGPVLAFDTQVWRDEPLLIPPVAASSNTAGGLFSIWYKLYFFACPTGSEQGATLKLPVTIGTIPLIQHLDFFDNGIGEGPLKNLDLPSPNFEPCVFGPYQIGAEGDREVRPIMYSPLYTSYVVNEDDTQ